MSIASPTVCCISRQYSFPVALVEGLAGEVCSEFAPEVINETITRTKVRTVRQKSRMTIRYVVSTPP